MTAFLLETLLWTALLISIVLLVRRPVARWFGPQLAYALWLLPLARLFIPPITLPAWLAPQQAAPVIPATQGGVSYEFITATTGVPATAQSLDWSVLMIAIWLGGAAIFLSLRFKAYFKMRAMLLDNAIAVGEAGNIRFIESAATSAPLAFGVFDRVIALPEGFMANDDVAARDLALEHELTHHRGGDLLINFAIQPLFSLHWFNPLGYAGWHAMRRDQEAACDARVVANRDAQEKAAYGEVIANFAASPNFSPGFNLAAPMACPVLGDKSIIQRLRSLTMSDISPRRRFAGRFAIGVAVLALPLTASITYAETTTPPASPAPPFAAEAPPAPPIPPALLHPETGGSQDEGHRAISVERISDGEDGEEEVHVVVRRHSEEFETIEDGEKRRVERRVIIRGDHDMSDEEIERLIDNAESRADMHTSNGSTVRMRFDRSDEDSGENSRLLINCIGAAEGGSGASDAAIACTAEATGQVLTALRIAREEISKGDTLDAEMKAEVLRELDEEIANLSQ